jgi:magnesium-transporting ATPase (P-type)
MGMELEKDLTLLGATAVEDALQIKVKETITRLLQADIKIWMITGDKLETAENIGLMAGILTQEMKTFYIRDVTIDNFFTEGKRLKERVENYSQHGDK